MPDRHEGQDRLLDRLETQAILKCGHRKFRELVASGRLPVVRLGPKTLRVRESDLRAFIASLGQVLGAVFVLLFALAAGLTPAEREAIRAQVRESRIKQGLPPTVQDPGVLARLAAAVLETDDDQSKARRNPGSAASGHMRR
jgi:excisionase family DNA binding protein